MPTSPNEDSTNTIARIQLRKNSYWLYHRQQVDEKHENLLEKKPEEKLW
jgi:hypothetical protein